MATGTIFRHTAQPRYALTLSNTKCKLYSRAVQTCQLRGFSCSGTVIGMKIRCFGVPGICLNIYCDFPLDFDGHSSCQIDLSWQNTQLIGERSIMPGMSTSVFLGCESQSHLSGALPVPASCVALISFLSYFHLISLAKTPHHNFKLTNQNKNAMPWKSFLHKCTRAHFAVGCILASLQLFGVSKPSRSSDVNKYFQGDSLPANPPSQRRHFFQARHIGPVLFGNISKGELGYFNSHSYRAPQLLLEIFSPVEELVWVEFLNPECLLAFWAWRVCVAALPTKLAWENVKCKSSVKMNKTRNLHVEATAHCFSWMLFILPFPPGSPIISTFALFYILIRVHSLNCALWWSKTFYSNAIQ